MIVANMAILIRWYVVGGFAQDRVASRGELAIVTTFATSGGVGVIKGRPCKHVGGVTGFTIILGWDMRRSRFTR